MEKLTTKCLGAFSITKVSSSGPAGSGAVDSVNGKTGSVIITKSDIGLSKVNNTSDLNKPISTATQQALNEIDSKILANKDDIDALQTDVADINHELSTFTTDADVDAKITEHNLHDQSHNDIRNSLVETNREVATKAGKVTVSDNKQEVGTVAVIHTDGSYIASDTKLTELKNSIDALNSDMGAFVSVSQDAALKSKDNTFTASNTFSGNVAFNGSKIHLTNNASVINGKNDKAILTTKGDDTNDQTTYIGGDKVEIYSPDSVSIETNQITIKRNGTNYTNIDSGNISEYAAGGSATPVIEKYGIKGDYQTHYGIINCQNGLIKYSYNNRRITVPAGLQLLLPNNNDIITTVSGDIVYDITSNDHFTLFYASEYDELLLEAGDVFYQVEEPDNGASNFIAWYNPEIDAWKFKSATAGNVWSEATRATPLADIRLSGDNITRIDYVGYRVFNNQIFALKEDSVDKSVGYTVENLISGKDIEIVDVLPEGGIDEHTLGCWHLDGNIENAANTTAFLNSKTATLTDQYLKFGAGSASITGNSDSSNASSFGELTSVLDDWTIDFWWRPTKNSGGAAYLGTISYNVSYAIQNGLGVFLYPYNNEIRFYNSTGSDSVKTASYNFTANNWYHIALVRKSNNLSLFINGILINYIDNVSTNFNTKLFISVSGSGNYIDELRTSDIARYTDNFIPPTKAYSLAEPTGKKQINFTGTIPEVDTSTLATKEELSNYLPLSGGTMNGNLTFPFGKKLIVDNEANIKTIIGNPATTILVENNSSYRTGATFQWNAVTIGNVDKNQDIYLQGSSLKYNSKNVLTESNKSVANGVASLDTNSKVPLAQLPYTAGDNITISDTGVISATGGTGATPETVTGDKVQVSYTRNDVAEETNLNAFCDGVVHDVDNLASIVPTECEQVVTTNTNQTITGNKTFSTAIVANGGVRMAAGQALSAGSDTLVQMVQKYSANGTDTDSVIVGAQGSTDRLILQANAGVLHKRGSAFFEVIDSGNIADNIPSNVVKSNEITTIKRLTQAEYDALTTKDENTFYVVTGA